MRDAAGARSSYLRYFNRGSSGVPSRGLSGSLPGCQAMTSSILRAKAKSLSLTPLAFHPDVLYLRQIQPSS